MIGKNDFIEVEYTGRQKDDSSVFDTTYEKIAKENHIYNKDASYGPIIICMGEKHIIRGIEEFLEGKEPGEYNIDIKPEDGFGKKNPKLVHLIPAKKFIEHEIKPVPGLSVNVDGRIGFIKTVSGGRVLVDFNHPLAGKELEYDIKVNRIVKDRKEQVFSLLNIILSTKKEEADIQIEGENCTVKLKKKLPEEVLGKVAEKIKELTKLSKIEITPQ